MTSTTDVVAKLWNLCNVLRDDGITYQDYVTELTFLLFLKMMKETGRESHIPKKYRWNELTDLKGTALLSLYKEALLRLGSGMDNSGKSLRLSSNIKAIFSEGQTKLRKPANLKTLVSAIDALDWFSAKQEGLGDLYEGLLQKNANEKKSGAGQYFTPRILIDCLIRVCKPQLGEVIHDPAAGTGGFLVAAHAYVCDQTKNLTELPKGYSAEWQRKSAYHGIELVPDTHRLAMMNLMLHGIDGSIILADTLTKEGAVLCEQRLQADLVLTNPPFGTKKGGGRPTRDDFTVTGQSSNKQFGFVEHIVRSLKPGGRAAIVLPDNVLFEENVGKALRRWLLDLCDVHTILRLPTGIFYAQGVKTNVLFLTRGHTDKANTRKVWVYDLRANMQNFGKSRPLAVEDFALFERAYGKDPLGKSRRKDEGVAGRFRSFDYEYIKQRNFSLDIAWLPDGEAQVGSPINGTKDIADAIISHLTNAIAAIESASMALSSVSDNDHAGAVK